MSAQAPPLGWVVLVRVWNQPDEHYFVTLSDPRHAEAEVRAVVQATWQTTVQVIRELTRDEIESVGLQPGKIVYAPKK